ncbi:MAG: methylated-DNA--[protein]-cysteine S-methyltransferase [Bacteroides sp.]|nr:methylated-DNA--[protein]-cysteine S-methyltransferase [Bacteroides sp.]MCM1389280.1 methylated-DNA--[protein]-cysteine S-methyltransferase [Bacteroides sp.]
MAKSSITYQFYESHCGNLTIGSIEGMLCLCDWTDSKRHSRNISRLKRLLNADFRQEKTSITDTAIRQIEEYFSGTRRLFEIPLLLAGTELQKRVWIELQNIPYAATGTYADIALRCGKANAVRAIANAIGANPLSIIIPCHRVIGSDGTLTGYAGGIPAKRHLIDLERKIVSLQ